VGFFDSAFNPGKRDLKKAKKVLKNADFKGGSLFGAGGLGAGFSFDEKGNINTRTSLGEFAPLFQQMLGLSGDAFGRAGNMMGNIDQQFAPTQEGLANIFASAEGIASQDPLQRGSAFADMLRQRRSGSARSEINNTFDRLFQSGGLSNQVTREQTLDAESRRLADEDLGFDMAGAQFGEMSVQNAFQRAMGASQQQQAIPQAINAALTGALGIGQQSMQGAQGLAQMPMMFMEMLANLQGARSNAALGQAAGHINVANSAQSTLMNVQKFHTQNVNNFKNFTEGMGNIMGGMSDRRLKTNIKLVGNVADVNIYTWDYLWGAPGIGVMADEVPHAAFDVGGYQAVDYSRVWS
jgi:hypothetical protein